MERLPFTPRRIGECIVMSLLAILLAGFIMFVTAMVEHAFARDQGQWKYAAPDVQEYFKTLKQPDNKTSSCCGDSDAYYADKTDQDPDGTLVAIITDTRPDEWTLDDGKKVTRPHIDVGTRIRVPPEKIRKPAIANPTGHTLIFVNHYESGMWVFCYEPQPLT